MNKSKVTLIQLRNHVDARLLQMFHWFRATRYRVKFNFTASQCAGTTVKKSSLPLIKIQTKTPRRFTFNRFMRIIDFHAGDPLCSIVSRTRNGRLSMTHCPLIRNVFRGTYSVLVVEYKDVSYSRRVTTTWPQNFQRSLRGRSWRKGWNLQKGRFTAGDFV